MDNLPLPLQVIHCGQVLLFLLLLSDRLFFSNGCQFLSEHIDIVQLLEPFFVARVEQIGVVEIILRFGSITDYADVAKLEVLGRYNVSPDPVLAIQTELKLGYLGGTESGQPKFIMEHFLELSSFEFVIQCQSWLDMSLKELLIHFTELLAGNIIQPLERFQKPKVRMLVDRHFVHTSFHLLVPIRTHILQSFLLLAFKKFKKDYDGWAPAQFRSYLRKFCFSH